MIAPTTPIYDAIQRMAKEGRRWTWPPTVQRWPSTSPSQEGHAQLHQGFQLGCRYCDRRRWRDDHDYFIESCLWVPHIDGGRIVPFEMNPGQRALSEVWRIQQAKGEPVRVVC